jgi:hypothetical protein
LEPRHKVLGLVAVQLGDAVFNAVPTQGLRDDLDRLRVPERMRFAFPVIKGASAVGLLAGLRWPRLGQVTATALVAYFTCALGAHARVRDRPVHYAPAAGMLVWSIGALRAFRD